jgi:hypothetical protein
MNEPFADRLSRFTPADTGLDRDALLFAAGQASVRPSRTWPLLTSALAITQVVTLVLLWPRVPEQEVRPSLSPAEVVVASPQPSSVIPQRWALRQHMLSNEGELPPSPAPEEALAPENPPLRAGAFLTSMSVD